MESNPVRWFEIYVQDMGRAKKFLRVCLSVEIGEAPTGKPMGTSAKRAAAWCVGSFCRPRPVGIRMSKGPARGRYFGVSKKGGKKIARIAVARKLLATMYHMMKEEIDYEEFLRRGGNAQ